MALLKNIGLVLVSAIVAVCAGEFVLRGLVGAATSTMDDFSLSRSEYYRPDAELGWLPRPGIEGVHNRQGRFSSRFSTNSYGLRDREHTTEKAPGVVRAVVLGDSFAWGWGVDDGEVFTDVLEKLLPDAEFVNLGVTGYSLAQEIAYFERLGMRFEPDVLLVAFVQNDVYQTEYAAWRNVAERGGEATFVAQADEPEEHDRLFKRLKGFLSDNLTMYRLATQVVNSNRRLANIAIRIGLKEEWQGFERLDPNIATALKEYPSVVVAGWARTFEQLRRLRDTTKARGIRLIVALVPALQSVEPSELNRSIAYTVFHASDFEIEKPYRLMEAFGRALDIEVINPLRSFVDASAAGYDLFLPGDMHFNAAGHELFAREIANHLTSQ